MSPQVRRTVEWYLALLGAGTIINFTLQFFGVPLIPRCIACFLVGAIIGHFYPRAPFPPPPHECAFCGRRHEEVER